MLPPKTHAWKTPFETLKHSISSTVMKPIIKNFDPFAIVFFAVAVAIAMTSSDSLWAQAPWSSPLFPPLEQPQTEVEDEQEERGLLGNAFASLEALSVPNESDALEKYSKGASDFEEMFEPLLQEARQSLVMIRSTLSLIHI